MQPRRTLVSRLLPHLPRPLLPPWRRSVLPAAFPACTRARYTGITRPRCTPFRRLVFTKRPVIMRFYRRVRCLPASATEAVTATARPTPLPPLPFIYSPNPAAKLCALSSLLYDLSSILVKEHTGWSKLCLVHSGYIYLCDVHATSTRTCIFHRTYVHLYAYVRTYMHVSSSTQRSYVPCSPLC